MNRAMSAYLASRACKAQEREAMVQVAGEDTGVAIFNLVEEKRRAQAKVSQAAQERNRLTLALNAAESDLTTARQELEEADDALADALDNAYLTIKDGELAFMVVTATVEE